MLTLMFIALTISSAATKIAAVAVIVYPVLQLLKKLFPGISGWLAFALNIALSFVGVLVTTPSDQIFTVPTLLALITAVAASAGVHGTVSALAPKQE